MSHNSNKSFHWSAHSYCKKMKYQQQQSAVIKTTFGLTEGQDYDSFHFFENESEQDFYAAPTPSEDIWKKFELIPTPPRSPRRDEDDDTDAMDMVDGIFSPKSTTERLQLVSEILDDPIAQTVITPNFFKCACSPNIKSKLIQDCMWSGPGGVDQDSDEKPEEKPVEKKPTVTVLSSNTDCVDPSSVFPYPINDTSKSVRNRHSLGVETPSESEKDDDSDDDDDDDDDEEIDVVTIENATKTFKRQQPAAQIVPNIKIKVKALSVPHRSPVVTAPFLHNYSLKRKSLSMPASPQPCSKKIKREIGHVSLHDFKKAVRRLQANPNPGYSDGRTSRSGSDSEDCEEKRAQHNVLERKRRNDLKFSFFTLRDQIPDLERQERAPKVVILRKASEYIIGLRREQRRLELLKQAEQTRKEQLQRKLLQLRRTSY